MSATVIKMLKDRIAWQEGQLEDYAKAVDTLASQVNVANARIAELEAERFDEAEILEE
ncbi:hypothetical protein [Ochrobactrum sp. Marseille-Q0166]|uniref:hypothetical protein n=1 Tax=Ochrobactrum sp. Marseille-Q0166 TaxID=2761105 RepID=UPI00165576FB|nr:hypothetical protein [Ochrobactrum sp. Marseille-Q0166]MBC8718177.1 hypothetical protein [Ochrobactrum sp. Marseille-Q0166]